MAIPFRQSASGRMLMVAAACFLGAAAAWLMTGSIYALGIGMPLGITIAFVAVGLALEDYTRETLIVIFLLPPFLWIFYFFMSDLRGSSGWGWVMAILAALFLGLAAYPGASED